MQSNEIDDYLRSLKGSNLRLADDAMGLLCRLIKDGVIQRLRYGEPLRYGSSEFRAITGLYALANTLFDQATPQDQKAFDLYDALRQALPDKQIPVGEAFSGYYVAWRRHTPYTPAVKAATTDLTVFRRVSEFMKACV